MSSNRAPLPGHALWVRIIGGLGGLAFVGGAIVAGIGQQIGPASIIPYGLWLVGAGFVGLGVAGALIRYGRCPSCGTIMKQGLAPDGAKFDGKFECTKCGQKWSTTETSRMHFGTG